MEFKFDSFSKEFEELFKKTTQANKIFLTEGSKFIKNINLSESGGKNLIDKQSNLMKDGLNLFIKLNLQYASNLIDLGVALSKKLNETDSISSIETNGSEQNDGPAFTLETSVIAGDTANSEFVLDTNKSEPIICDFKPSEYSLLENPDKKVSFNTKFTPSSFELSPGNSQKILIEIKIPINTQVGNYKTDIIVQGFEHTFFSLIVKVEKKPAKNSPKRK